MSKLTHQTGRTSDEETQLDILRRAFALVEAHKSELSKAALTNNNPVHVFVELVGHGWLQESEFEQLVGKGFYRRWTREFNHRTPENSAALAQLRRLKKMLAQDMWRDIDSGKRPHPLDVLGKRR